MTHWFKKWLVNDPWILKKLFNCKTIVGSPDQVDSTPYMTRLNVGKFFIHVFWRGDADEDCHDHPWDFWTFPLYPRAGYYEEYVRHKRRLVPQHDGTSVLLERYDPTTHVQLVPGWKWTFRYAEHTHRVLYPATANGGSYSGYTNQIVNTHHSIIPEARAKQAHWPIVTFVIKEKTRRSWGFLRNRDDKWCWTPWKEYVFGNGKNAPC